MKHEFNIENSLKNIVKLGVIYFHHVQIEKYTKALAEEIASYCSWFKATYPSTESLQVRLKISRDLYKALKLDPTKIRPSSEALIRRILKDQQLYQINTIVDICNLCSIHFFLSIGLYDVHQIVSDTIWLRIGKAGESYSGIGKENVNVSGRFTLADAIGPFGNPSADSDRTKITLETTEVLFVVFAPKEYENENLELHLNFIESKVKLYHHCKTVDKFLV